MSTLIKLMFAPLLITVMGIAGLYGQGIVPSVFALALILIVLLATGISFLVYEAHMSEEEPLPVDQELLS